MLYNALLSNMTDAVDFTHDDVNGEFAGGESRQEGGDGQQHVEVPKGTDDNGKDTLSVQIEILKKKKETFRCKQYLV